MSLVSFDASRYLALPDTARIRRQLDITVAERAFPPRPDDLPTDWVASVAVPAFKLLRRSSGQPLRSFCALGTGCGVDALAAIELLEAERVGITDLFEEVVATARRNILENLRPDLRLELLTGQGDLLEPLRGRGLSFDVIYENLPNLPLADATRLTEQRTSAAFLPPRSEPIPDFVRTWLLSLHFLAIRQAAAFLTPQGAVLSTLGGRVPLQAIIAMAEAAGLNPTILTYGWKIQADPQENIAGYATWQRQGLGPFYFYPVEVLDAAFAGLSSEAAGLRALELEQTLVPHRLDAIAAERVLGTGIPIGHTVVVLKSGLRS